MIAFISGEVAYIGENVVIIDNGGIGYEINVSNNTLVKCTANERVTLQTYMQVKEDGISLFGFATEEEKSMFLRLISISGVGPKVALAILSGMRVNDLAFSILNEDVSSLVRIKGLGKKTAERIILELKEKVSPMETLIKSMEYSGIEKPVTGEYAEAVTVLVSLGLSKADAVRRVRAAEEQGMKSAENILNFALKTK